MLPGRQTVGPKDINLGPARSKVRVEKVRFFTA